MYDLQGAGSGMGGGGGQTPFPPSQKWRGVSSSYRNPETEFTDQALRFLLTDAGEGVLALQARSHPKVGKGLPAKEPA